MVGLKTKKFKNQLVSNKLPIFKITVFLKRLIFLEMFFKKMGMESTFVEEIVSFPIVFN